MSPAVTEVGVFGRRESGVPFARALPKPGGPNNEANTNKRTNKRRGKRGRGGRGVEEEEEEPLVACLG